MEEKLKAVNQEVLPRLLISLLTGQLSLIRKQNSNDVNCNVAEQRQIVLNERLPSEELLQENNLGPIERSFLQPALNCPAYEFLNTPPDGFGLLLHVANRQQRYT